MKEKIVQTAPFLVFAVLLASTFTAWIFTQRVVKIEIKQNFNQEVQVIDVSRDDHS